MNLRSGFWILLVAAAVLEAISCIQYFTSKSAIRAEAELRAKTELRRAELEIEIHTIEIETAAKTLAKLVEKHINIPDSVYSATRLAVSTLRGNTSLAVAFVPNYFPKEGKFFEACSSRITEDSIYTRQIGTADHDYTEMEWYQNGFVHDSCWWCEPYLDDSGSQTYVVSCSCPVRNNTGEVVAVACVDLSLKDLKNLSDYLQVYPNSYYSIRSSTGQDIVPIPDTIPGRKYNIFHEEIDATGWHIEIIIPEDVLFADLNRIGIIVGILMLLGLALLVLIIVLSARDSKRLAAVDDQRTRMTRELEIAKNIQMAMLPKNGDSDLWGLVKPAKKVGGDLYDFYEREGKLYFCIGDVSGKGVPASLVMAMTRSFFRSLSLHERNVAKLATQMNGIMSENNDSNMFVTLFLGVLDLNTGDLDYCNAGHNAPVHLPFGHLPSTIDFLPVHPNLPMGIEHDFPFEAQHTRLQRGDVLFLYTDGLTEAENSNHELYGEARLLASLQGKEKDMPQELIVHVQADVEAFVGDAEQSDDLTMLVIRRPFKQRLVMRNDIQQIPTLAEWIDTLDIPQELNMPINLALEEIVTNVMLYAYPGKYGQVLVEFNKDETDKGEHLVFTVSDGGIPFDPTQRPEADITLSAEERQIGGLGIHLVRQLMDEIHYERKDGKNILTLVKRIEK